MATDAAQGSGPRHHPRADGNDVGTASAGEVANLPTKRDPPFAVASHGQGRRKAPHARIGV